MKHSRTRILEKDRKTTNIFSKQICKNLLYLKKTKLKRKKHKKYFSYFDSRSVVTICCRFQAQTPDNQLFMIRCLFVCLFNILQIQSNIIIRHELQITHVKRTVWHEIQINNRLNDKSTEIRYKWIYADSQGREIYPRKEMATRFYR